MVEQICTNIIIMKIFIVPKFAQNAEHMTYRDIQSNRLFFGYKTSSPNIILSTPAFSTALC